MAEKYTTIGKYLKPVKREVLLDPEQKYDLLGVKWYGKGVFIRETKLGKEIKAKKLFKVITGDFIYNRLFAWKSSFAIIPKEFSGCLVSGEFPLFIKKYDEVNTDFILQYILLPHNIAKVDKLSTGMSSVSRKRFKENSFLSFPIPDLNKDEQDNIAEKISRHILSNQNFLNEVEQQEKLLKQLRQAILQEAVEGKLTAEWRKKNPELISGENHAARLLEKIKADKAALTKNTKGTKRQKPLPPISEDEKPFDLPDGWVWCRLGSITHVFAGYSFKSYDFNKTGGIRCIKITNVGVKQLKITDDYLPASFQEKYSDFLVRSGNLVIALTRPYISEGLKISRCPIEYDNSLLNQRVAAIRNLHSINFDYIYLYMISDFVLNGYKNKFEKANLQPNLRMSDLTELSIPLPPIAEQQAIVEKVDRIMAKIDALEEQVKSRKEQAEQLMQAVLREAFNGE